MDSRSKPGFGLPASGMVSMGRPSCCACHAARAMLPLFSLPSEISATRGIMPAGNDATASRIPASRSVARPASPEVCRKRRLTLERAFEEAGRGDLRFSLMTGCIVGESPRDVERRVRNVMQRTGEDGEINILNPAGGHEPEFIEWRWEPMRNLPDLVIPFKREVYTRVVEAFAHLVK